MRDRQPMTHEEPALSLEVVDLSAIAMFPSS
jgi:hypothetical protein